MSFKTKLLFFLLPYCFSTSLVFAQTFSSSNLPLVFIKTNGLTIVDEPKIKASMGIVWNGPGKRNGINDPKNDFNGNITIEIRGSSSQEMFPKKSYGFETKTLDWLDMDVPLLGMPEENDWILYAPYTDKTMMRDVLTYTLDASMGHWSPRCRYVELFVNNVYQGVYVLMEKIKRNKNRVDIAKLLTTDISGENLTGGYIIKIDKMTGGGDGWTSSFINNTNSTYYQYHYPKATEITPEQKAYIKSFVYKMESALYMEKFTGAGSYHEFLNDTSFIDFMIMNELSKNIDGYRLSSYLYKGKNGVINCGPIWDFNLAYGNASYYDGFKTIGFEYQIDFGGDFWQNPFWWNKLMKDPAYVLKLKRRWSWIRKHEFSNQRITHVADSLASLLSEAQARNYQRWTGVIGSYVWPNYYIGTTYASEVTWMKNWLTQRLAYLDKQWYYNFTENEDLLAVAPVSVYPNPFVDKVEVRMANKTTGGAVAELYNQNSTLIWKREVVVQNGCLALETTDCHPGMYILRIRQNEHTLFTGKIVKVE